jgi:ABC-type lipoprotein export system ATPase subunit/GNAT superfamily N-acetyltransferase
MGMKRRREYFRIQGFARTYDRLSGKFVFDVRYKTSVPLTDRTIAVAEAFGLGIDEKKEHIVLDNVELRIGPHDIVYVTGDSGSGKSVLLRALKKDLGDEAIDIGDVQVDRSKPLIETVGRTVEEGLELLSRVGLNDAFLFLRKYPELSDGQKYRYRLAKLVESGKKWWIMDEFCATLDRDTAKIIAFNLQKLARQQRKAVIAATTHTDLMEDLNPNMHVHKRFGKEIAVSHLNPKAESECSLVREMYVAEGKFENWRQLAHFHYRCHKVAAPRKIFCLWRKNGELCGVIVYTYPGPQCFGRKASGLTKYPMREINKRLGTISRVVVHPKYRTIGLGVKLVRETLGLVGTEFIEMPAVMAKYNPFAEKAGMTKVCEQRPSKEVQNIVRVLYSLGFNLQFLSSYSYVLSVLSRLKPSEIMQIKQAFIKNQTPRFLKFFASHQPYGTVAGYRNKVTNLDPERLANLIKACGFLLQTKVYLLWRKPSARPRRASY